VQDQFIMLNSAAKPPMAGLTVIDFTSMLAGPYCTRLLADCGADVIKIEPAAGDAVRNFPPIVEGNSAYFAQLNCGKKSIVLDLANDEGKRAALDLAAGADVVVENFRPGVINRLGLGYETLSATNTELVYCSISGFGQTGPRAQDPAYAPIVHAASGFDQAQMDIQADGGPPNKCGIFTADILAAVYAFGAIQSALLGRARHGGGQFIDVALMDAMINLLIYDAQVAQNSSETPRTVYAPSPASDGFVVITPVSQKNFQQMADAMDHPEWKTDARFAEMRARRQNWDALVTLMAEWTVARPAAECESILAAAGVPCSRYKTIADAMSDPQSIDRGLMTRVSDADGGYLVPNPPFRFADGSVGITPKAPRLGEHTEEILSRI
jgi:CoA:oxalate CoA-transferase